MSCRSCCQPGGQRVGPTLPTHPPVEISNRCCGRPCTLPLGHNPRGQSTPTWALPVSPCDPRDGVYFCAWPGSCVELGAFPPLPSLSFTGPGTGRLCVWCEELMDGPRCCVSRGKGQEFCKPSGSWLGVEACPGPIQWRRAWREAAETHPLPSKSPVALAGERRHLCLEITPLPGLPLSLVFVGDEWQKAYCPSLSDSSRAALGMLPAETATK